MQEKIDLVNKIKEIEAFTQSVIEDELGLLLPITDEVLEELFTPEQVLIQDCLDKLNQALEVIKELQNEVQNLLTENDVAGFINTNNLQKTIVLTEENAALKSQINKQKPPYQDYTWEDIALVVQESKMLKAQVLRVKDTGEMRRVIHSTVEMFDGEAMDLIKQLQNYILRGEGV